LPQQSVSLRFNGDSVLPYPLRRSFDYCHLILFSSFFTKAVHSATLSAILDGGRNSVNGFLVCIDPAFALVHKSEPFETFISATMEKC
jgi:hypothetical protein